MQVKHGQRRTSARRDPEAGDGRPATWLQLTRRATELVEADPAAAGELADRALAAARAAGDGHACSRNLCTIGTAALAAREYERAEAALDEALSLAETLDDHALRRDARRGLLKAAFFSQDHDAALDHGIAALYAARLCEDAEQTAVVHNELAMIYGSANDFEGALEHLLAGLELLGEADTVRHGTLLNNVGNVYLELGEPAQALDFFASARDTFVARNQARSAAIAAGNIGRARLLLGDPAGAREIFAVSLGEFQAAADDAYVVPALARVAEADDALGDTDAARAGFARSLAALDEAPRPEFGDEALLAAARFHLGHGEVDPAIELLRRALATPRSGATMRRRYDLHRLLADAYERCGDAAAALREFREFHRLRAEVADAAVTIRMRGMMLQFDLERARQEQEIYRLRNVELARANGELRRLHAELESRNRELQQISLEDALTGVHNRRFLDAQLDHELARSVRRARPLSVAICDLDRFKEINDALSHPVGDQVLRALGELFRGAVRHDDVVARYGGEEFVVLMPETDLDGARVLAERLRGAVEEYRWTAIHPELAVTLSVGLATLEPGLDADGLLAIADRRLYQAKHAGRNRVAG